MTNREDEKIKREILKILADHIGVDLKDLKEEDRFFGELHMSPSDLSDFLVMINTKLDIDTSKLDLENLESIRDLFDALSL